MTRGIAKGQLVKLAMLLVLVLGSSGVPAYALAAQGTPPEVTYTVEKGKSASASWSACTTDEAGTTCHNTDIFAFEGQRRSDTSDPFVGSLVCVNIETFFPDETYEYESRCISVPKSTLDFHDLSSASLEPTTITLDKYRCDQTCEIVSTRDVTIAATWTSTGPLTEFKNHYKFREGSCTDTFKAVGEAREATVVATLNDASLGDASVANLLQAQFVFERSCR